MVLENCYRADSHECPFGRASIELTKLLCEILQVHDLVFRNVVFRGMVKRDKKRQNVKRKKVEGERKRQKMEGMKKDETEAHRRGRKRK